MPLFQEINMSVFTIYSCQYGTLFNLYIPDYIYISCGLKENKAIIKGMSINLFGIRLIWINRSIC